MGYKVKVHHHHVSTVMYFVLTFPEGGPKEMKLDLPKPNPDQAPYEAKVNEKLQEWLDKNVKGKYEFVPTSLIGVTHGVPESWCIDFEIKEEAIFFKMVWI